MSVRYLVLLALLALCAAPAAARAQSQAPVVTPCDDPLYRQLLLREMESMTSAERTYLAQANYSCADYLRAVQVVRLYVDDRPPARFFKDPQLAQTLAVPIPGGEPVVLEVGLGAASVFWLIGVVDAPASARRANARVSY